MEWIAAMQQAITYMEEHLMEEINYEDVAKHVHTSSYEFHRAFSFLTGMTANSYIRNRRLSLAGREIVETDAKITDIALKYGYETPESFTKAFTRFHGIGVLIAEDTSEFDCEKMEKAGYRIWDVKPGTYVVFDCIGEDSDFISDTWSKFYKEFLPQMGYEAEVETDYEIYFEKGRSGLFCELWIPIRKK